MDDLWLPEDDGVPDGAIGRLLQEVAVGTHQRIRSKDAADDKHKLREIEQQFQFLINGTATPVITFEEVTVPFDYAFYYAPAQRESNLAFPHFTYGSQTNPAVGVHATVTGWMHENGTGAINGAAVAVGVTGNGESFTGVVHLTFQGFGALIESGFEGEGE